MRYAPFLAIALVTTPPMLRAQVPVTQRPSAACCQQPALVPGFTGGNAPGQRPSTSASTADIAVIVKNTSVEKVDGGGWLFTVSIANDNGNNCTPKDNTKAILQLPPDCQVDRVEVTRADGGAAMWTQCGAYLEVQLGELCPADGKIGKPCTVKVHVKASPYEGGACLPAFGVFAFSGMPDHVPGNNSWWWRSHCTDGTTYYPQEQPLPSKGL